MKGDGKTRLLGFGLPTPTYELEERLPNVIRSAFTAACEHDMAVMLHFDLHLAWKKRPDLWNWFDPKTLRCWARPFTEGSGGRRPPTAKSRWSWG
jgi:hypothetical protein